ncbi:hypothetical protein ACXWO0_09700, partial [Streptococcus pyogenes]
MQAGNVDGIFQKAILPLMRENKDPRLIQYWDHLIQREAESASDQKLAFAAGSFEQQRKPILLWNRAKDMLALGWKNRA